MRYTKRGSVGVQSHGQSHKYEINCVCLWFCVYICGCITENYPCCERLMPLKNCKLLEIMVFKEIIKVVIPVLNIHYSNMHTTPTLVQSRHFLILNRENSILRRLDNKYKMKGKNLHYLSQCLYL